MIFYIARNNTLTICQGPAGTAKTFVACYAALGLLADKKIEKIIQDKIKLFQAENKVDWATGELMAYASLLANGQDVSLFKYENV